MSYLGAQNSIALGVQGLIHIDTGGGAGGSADYLLAKSLRFRSSASAYLNRTASASISTFTVSMWVKRGSLTSNFQYFFSYNNSGNTDGYGLAFNQTTDTLYYYNGTAQATTAAYRDPAAWYHIVFSNNAGAFTLYVNGVSVKTGTATAIPSSSVMNLGRYGFSSTFYFDGELAEVNFVDGQALAPTSFGAFSTYNQWLPIKYAGTYGTNGFYLPFTNTASTSTLVADSSGNANNWTPNNISLTAGSTYDSLTDVPTLTSATVANYAVLNPFQNGGGTLSGGNLNLLGASAAWGTRLGTIAVTSGKWYFEVTPTSGSATAGIHFGITQNAAPAGFLGQDANGYSYYGFNGQKYNNNAGVAYGATVADNDVVGVAFDVTAGTLTFYKNNVSQGVAFSSLAAGTWFLGVSCYNTATASINFGQQPFTYTPPTGFLALNTYNI